MSTKIDFNRFGLLSKETILVILIGLIFSGFVLIPLPGLVQEVVSGDLSNMDLLIGYILIFIAPLLFAFFTPLFRIFSILPRMMLFFSKKKVHFLDYLPGFSIKGEWFVEKHGERRDLQTSLDVISFLGSRWHSLFFINLGIYALFFQLARNLGYQEIFSLASPINSVVVLGFLSIAPMFTALYFTWVWLWDDIELKIYKKEEKKSTELWLASDTPANIMGLIVGIGSILWLIDGNVDLGMPSVTPLIDILIHIGVLMVLFSGPTLMLGVFLYRSYSYDNMVNSLKAELVEKYRERVSSLHATTCSVCNGSGELDHETIPANITIAHARVTHNYMN